MPESPHCFVGITSLIDEDNAAFIQHLNYLNEDRLDCMLIRFVYNINIIDDGIKIQNSLLSMRVTNTNGG